ncbi:MAG: IS200/IS605 family transposase [Candidatus Saccharimonadales bacterium]
MKQYSVGAHTTHRLQYHLVWVPKYRKRVLRGPLAARLYELLRQCADMNEWYIEELNVQVDHVHLLVQLPPKEAVSHAVQLMKGGTSKVIREEFPELEEFLWGDSLWADGYFAESVGQVTAARIKAYIQNQ